MTRFLYGVIVKVRKNRTAGSERKGNLCQIHTFNSCNTYHLNSLQGTIMPTAEKAEWLNKVCLFKVGSSGYLGQMCLHILWNEQTGHSLCR